MEIEKRIGRKNLEMKSLYVLVFETRKTKQNKMHCNNYYGLLGGTQLALEMKIENVERDTY